MYQVLARKWRPKNFHELVGQTHVAQALTYALDHNRIHHAYLFTGTRGVGKTTIARIFAKSLNCQKNQISSNPCGECDHCLEIDQGRFPDLLEVDAASRTGVDDTRELLDNVPYAPVKGRFKVYLIDEVHMFSKSSFNALLKTLEEPPAHVKFILATTDPQKLPATILSRCLQFHLKNMSENQIAGHLAHILQQENAAFETEALKLLAHAAAGSMRDSLSLLDQALAYGQGAVKTHDVATLLGAISTPQLLNLLDAMINQDAKGMREILSTLDEYAPDYSALLKSLLQCLQKITLVQLNAQRPEDDIPQKLQQIAIRIPIELVQLWYQIATDTWQNLPYQPDARMALEMGLLRMIALQPVLPQMELDKVQAVPDIQTIPESASLEEIAANLQSVNASEKLEVEGNHNSPRQNLSNRTEPQASNNFASVGARNNLETAAAKIAGNHSSPRRDLSNHAEPQVSNNFASIGVGNNPEAAATQIAGNHSSLRQDLPNHVEPQTSNNFSPVGVGNNPETTAAKIAGNHNSPRRDLPNHTEPQASNNFASVGAGNYPESAAAQIAGNHNSPRQDLSNHAEPQASNNFSPVSAGNNPETVAAKIAGNHSSPRQDLSNHTEPQASNNFVSTGEGNNPEAAATKMAVESAPPPWLDLPNDVEFHSLEDDPYRDVPPWDSLPEELPSSGERENAQDSEVNREKKPFPPLKGNLAENATRWICDIKAWADFLSVLPLGDFPLILLENCRPNNWQDPVLSLFCNKTGESFSSAQNVAKAEEVISHFFDRPCKLEFSLKDDVLTPSLYHQQQNEQKEQELQENFLAHPMVKAAQAIFGANMRIDNIHSTQ